MASDPQNKSKLPSALSTEELLEIASKNTPIDDIDTSESGIEAPNDAVKFLLRFNLRPGGFPIQCSLLYKLYTASTHNSVSRHTFGTQCGLYLYQRQIGTKNYYLINEPAFTLSTRAFKLIAKKKKNPLTKPTYQKHFESFLKHHNLKKGKTYIPFYALYHIYDKWCFSIKRKQPMGYVTLHKFCVLYFKSKRINDSQGLMFAVSSNIMEHITTYEIKEIEIHSNLNQCDYVFVPKELENQL